jgi:hypothetical protein
MNGGGFLIHFHPPFLRSILFRLSVTSHALYFSLYFFFLVLIHNLIGNKTANDNLQRMSIDLEIKVTTASSHGL